jgi:hypothetical protein
MKVIKNGKAILLVINKAHQQLHTEPRLTFQTTEERHVN